MLNVDIILTTIVHIIFWCDASKMREFSSNTHSHTHTRVRAYVRDNARQCNGIGWDKVPKMNMFFRTIFTTPIQIDCVHIPCVQWLFTVCRDYDLAIVLRNSLIRYFHVFWVSTISITAAVVSVNFPLFIHFVIVIAFFIIMKARTVTHYPCIAYISSTVLHLYIYVYVSLYHVLLLCAACINADIYR